MSDPRVSPPRSTTSRVVLLAAIALLGFAANSLLCRLALVEGAIDPWSFLLVRFAAGAVVLTLLCGRKLGAAPRARGAGTWLSALALVAYGVGFSFAYLQLGAGVGALILFSSVQVTMIGWGIRCGEQPGPRQWLGLALALAGLVVLVRPGQSAPPLLAAAAMIAAGAAWGVYTLRGRGAADAIAGPLATTAGNFVRSVPFVLALWLLCWSGQHWSARGVLWAVLSGALASGLGYACWYAAVGHMSRTAAAIIQLAVPVLAGLGGVVLLNEAWTFRLALATALTIVGVTLATLVPVRAPRP